MSPEPYPEQALSEQVLALLREQPQGCSEYQLIQQLKAGHCTHIPRLPLTDKLVLFRTHFLLFNALYRLREQLWAQASAHLHISPLHIQLQPYTPATQALEARDPLRDYYLDLNQLQQTTQSDVEALLASFWSRMQGSEDKVAALQLFELDEASTPVNLALIKSRYRQLVSLHHPDRGGSTRRLQSINLAMEILQRYYR